MPQPRQRDERGRFISSVNTRSGWRIVGSDEDIRRQFENYAQRNQGQNNDPVFTVDVGNTATPPEPETAVPTPEPVAIEEVEEEEEDTEDCQRCGDSCPREDMHEIGSDYYCEDCCQHCDSCEGIMVDGDDTMEWVDDNVYCESCYSDIFFYCTQCDSSYDRGEDHATPVRDQHGTSIFCLGCIEEGINQEDIIRQGGEYVTRDSGLANETKVKQCINMCETTIQEMNEGNSGFCRKCAWGNMCAECRMQGTPRCSQCLFQTARKKAREETRLWPQKIWPENYHPQQHNYFKQNKYRLENEHPFMYYGVEIEVALPDRVNRRQFAEKVVQETGGLFVVERDSSVPGLEFISRPTSYKQWISQDMEKRLRTFAELCDTIGGAPTVPQNNCGMHVHMSTKFFQKSKTKSVQEQIEDMAWLFEFYEQEVSAISMRNINQFCQTHAWKFKRDMRNTDFKAAKAKLTLEKDAPVMSQGSGDSHHHIIAQTRNTLEVRSFATTWSRNQILANIEFCRNLAHAVRRYDLTGMNLAQILKMKESPHLDQFIKTLCIDLSRSKPLSNELEVSL